MKVIRARNVHQALPAALYALDIEGVTKPSRNGPVRKFDQPVTTVYERPTERVIFWPERDANPFFHLMESLWMLAGRNDVEYVAHFVPRMRSFSDNGLTLHGAYGYRWRLHFAFDQITEIIGALKADPTDRRQVLSMWDAASDLGKKGKDFPCNLQALFSVNNAGALDMVVTNRSNDIVLGAYGANAVHFSYLQEYVASSIGIPVGRYWQVSANFHLYEGAKPDVSEVVKRYKEDDWEDLSFWTRNDPYEACLVQPFPLMTAPKHVWDEELSAFMSNPGTIGLTDPFFRRVAVPMLRTHEAYKNNVGLMKFQAAQEALQNVRATDWKLAAEEWLDRRHKKFLAQNDDGVAYE